MARTKSQLRAAAAFFAANAASSYRPGIETREAGRRRAGRILAIAEAKARREGLVFSWEPDLLPDLSWVDKDRAQEEHTAECCIVYRRCECCGRVHEGEPLASLWGIVDADADYRRVVEAELASEALISLRA